MPFDPSFDPLRNKNNGIYGNIGKSYE